MVQAIGDRALPAASGRPPAEIGASRAEGTSGPAAADAWLPGHARVGLFGQPVSTPPRSAIFSLTPEAKTLTPQERWRVVTSMADFGRRFSDCKHPEAVLTYLRATPGYATARGQHCCGGHCKGCRSRVVNRFKVGLTDYLLDALTAKPPKRNDRELEGILERFLAGRPVEDDKALKKLVVTELLPHLVDTVVKTPSREIDDPRFGAALRVLDRAFSGLEASEQRRITFLVTKRMSSLSLTGHLDLYDKDRIEDVRGLLFVWEDLVLVADAVRFFLKEDAALPPFFAGR